MKNPISQKRLHALRRRVLDFLAPPEGKTPETAAPSEAESVVVEPIAPAAPVAPEAAPAEVPAAREETPRVASPRTAAPAVQWSSRTAAALNIGMLALVALDVAGLGRIAEGRCLQLALFLLRKSDLEGVGIWRWSSEQVHVLLALFLAFFLGGVLVKFLLQAADGLARAANLAVNKRHFTRMTAGLCALFLILTVISVQTGHPYTAYGTFRWLAMLVTALGGLLFYGAGSVEFEV